MCCNDNFILLQAPVIAVSKQDSQPTPPPVHLYITHSIRTARYHTLQKPHNVQSIRRDNSSHQCYATESIFLLHHRQEDAGILQYSHFQRKMKQQEKGKRKHMAPKNLKPQLILKKKKTTYFDRSPWRNFIFLSSRQT